LQRDGKLWRLSFDDRQLMLRRSKGLDMLARLIDTPEQDIHVLDLSGGSAVRGEAGRGPPALDDKARAEYEHRLQALREELEEADEFGDSGRAEAARTEIDFISRELARAFGLGGRTRRDGDAAERARVNVRRRLKDAIERIAKLDAEAGRYLENTVKTGTYCRYTPM
jgi:non-specific serine/threonine protein kinase